MEDQNITICHEGRGGHLEYCGCSYEIEHINNGHFCIHFPSGNKHDKMQEHLTVLKEFAQSQEPEWYVENKSKKYK